MTKYLYSGEIHGKGVYRCTCCGSRIVLSSHDPIPDCPKCTCKQYVEEDRYFSY